MEDSKHFEDDAWINLVRGILPAQAAEVMRKHLESRCAECQQTYETSVRIMELGSRQVAGVSDFPVRLVKAVSALRRRVLFRTGPALLAERVLDSFRDPLPGGIRGTVASPRELVYEAGGYMIDIRLEQSPGKPGALTGQILHAWTEGATSGAGVVLLQGNGVVGQTAANSIGEFQLDFERPGDLRLCLGIPDGALIEVWLPEVG